MLHFRQWQWHCQCQIIYYTTTETYDNTHQTFFTFTSCIVFVFCFVEIIVQHNITINLESARFATAAAIASKFVRQPSVTFGIDGDDNNNSRDHYRLSPSPVVTRTPDVKRMWASCRLRTWYLGRWSRIDNKLGRRDPSSHPCNLAT